MCVSTWVEDMMLCGQASVHGIPTLSTVGMYGQCVIVPRHLVAFKSRSAMWPRQQVNNVINMCCACCSCLPVGVVQWEPVSCPPHHWF